MSRRRFGGTCCCPMGCDVFFEDLVDCEIDKVDDWDEVIGTWTVTDPDDPNCLGNQYLSSSGAGSLLICKHPTVHLGQVVTIYFETVAGSKPRAILSYNYVTGNYLFVEFDINASQVNFGTGNSDTQSSNIIETFDCAVSGDELAHAWVTRFDGDCNKVLLSAQTEQVEHCQACGWICITSPGGKYAGIGDGSSTVARFGGNNPFELVEHEDNYPTCGYCECLCEYECIPWLLNYTMTGDEENPPCCDTPIVGTLLPVSTWGYNPTCEWREEGSLTCASGFSWSFEFGAEYGGHEVKRHPEISDFLFDFSDDTEGPGPPDGDSTCCPFYMKRHITFYIEDVDPPYFILCGYTVEVYE